MSGGRRDHVYRRSHQDISFMGSSSVVILHQQVRDGARGTRDKECKHKVMYKLKCVLLKWYTVRGGNLVKAE